MSASPLQTCNDHVTAKITSNMHRCAICQNNRAQVIRPKNGQKICKNCFLEVFELEVHTTIVENNIFPSRGERVAIGASGGKDSTVLAATLKALNERYDYGVEFVLLSIDEGIHGYRDDSLETVKRNAIQYEMELCIVGYDALYGWTMDKVVEKVGRKGNCTYCGVFRRQALDRGAKRLNISHILTGHNADDIAETVLMNLLRGDLPRLGRCAEIMTASLTSPMRRSKPLKYAYEKEIVLYAHYLRSGEQLIHNAVSPVNLGCEDPKRDRHEGKMGLVNGSQTLSDEPANPKLLPKIVHKTGNGATYQITDGSRIQTIGVCRKCGYMSSQPTCKACMLVDSLNRTEPPVEVSLAGDRDSY
ncbi:nucleotidyltransferase, variant 2 [Orbilia oligospora]|uniref:Nucleotidyltransferase, variant 2 n=1 Tax=Orbilia oligospora TaxID=2813651 RepID=A0A8H8VCW3_ORBOL|nr:nucleotidyltransferase, variant 2 [Orbilia oligospora]